jgi:prophage DNA circulation protein
MWERKTKEAKWNGNVLHIQSTTLDGGKRLQVAEMPYMDAPHIKVMGTKSRTLSIEVVFVGVNSLVDANALITELERNPEGELEHPYLGELSLVFETYSQTFSTKKGLVTLSLKFYKQGVPVTLTRIDKKSVSQLTTAVVDASNEQFIEAVTVASPGQIDAMKFDFTTVLNALRNIANRATQSSLTLARLHRQIEDGFTAIEMIKNAPSAYTTHFNAIVSSLKDVLEGDESSERRQTSNREQTQQALIETINPDAQCSHGNIQVTVAVVLLSEELSHLSHIEQVDIASFNSQPLNKMQHNIAMIQVQLNARVDDVSKEATFERLVLVDVVGALREQVNEQANKLTDFQQTLSVIDVVSTRPLLCIAQSHACQADELTSINAIQHPLFVKGTLQVSHA